MKRAMARKVRTTLLATLGLALPIAALAQPSQPVPPPFPPIPSALSSFFPPALLPTALPFPTRIIRPPAAPPAPTVAPSSVPPRTIQTHLLRPEATLLGSNQKSEQLRALQRAAATPTPESTALLLEQWTGRTRVIRDAEMMAVLVRGLAARTSEARVREALAGILGMWAPSDSMQSAHAEAVRYATAVALAENGSEEGVRALFLALERDATRDAAQSALLRFPPRKVPKGVPFGPASIDLLGKLGDLRFADTILNATSSSGANTRARALHAGAVMGDTRIADVARRSLNETSADVRVEATFALVHLRAMDADHLIALLLKSPETVTRGAELAELVPRASVVQGLREALTTYDDPNVSRTILATLANMPIRAALDLIVDALQTPPLRSLATLALARSSAPSAESRLLTLAERGGRADVHVALTAYALRRSARSFTNSRLDDLARKSRGSTDPVVCAPAWFIAGIAGEGPDSDEAVSSFLKTTPPAARRAYAAGLAYAKTRSPRALRAWLAHERDDATLRVLAAAVLNHPDTAHLLSRIDTFERAMGMGVDAPFATRAWISSTRLAGDDVERALAFLHSSSPSQRAAAIRGLGRGTLPSAVGILEEAYDAEPESNVRVAILLSLEELIQATEGGGERRSLESYERAFFRNIAAFDPNADARAMGARILRNDAHPNEPASKRPFKTTATLIPLTEMESDSVALYVGTGGVFRVVPFVWGEGLALEVPERSGHINFGVALP